MPSWSKATPRRPTDHPPKFYSQQYSQTCPMTTYISDHLNEAGVYIGIILLAGALFFSGNALFGSNKEGGKRLVLFFFSLLLSRVSTGMCYNLWNDFFAFPSPRALMFLIGAGCALISIYCIVMSLFGPTEKIRVIFRKIFRSL